MGSHAPTTFHHATSQTLLHPLPIKSLLSPDVSTSGHLWAERERVLTEKEKKEHSRGYKCSRFDPD